MGGNPLSAHAKSLAFVLISFLAAVQYALSDGTVTASEWANVGVAVVTAIGVHFASDTENWPYLKGLVALLGAAGVALSSALSDGMLTTSEINGVIIAGFAAIGVIATPNMVDGVKVIKPSKSRARR
jgi:hypothetical protein